MTDMTDSARPFKRPQSEPILSHPVPVELLEAWPLKCAYAVQEIFKTESDYVQDLYDMIEGYRDPLSNHLRADNEGHRIISTLFCNVDQLYDLHKSLLQTLRNRQTDPHGFGQVFVNTEEDFMVYSAYCSNYHSAADCLHVQCKNSKELAIFIEACQHNMGHSLPLSSQLIKPVQRIMRYHIMLKEVVKNFDRNHHGYHSLRSAHKAMVNIVDYINEAKRRKENAQRIVDLQNSVTGWAGQGSANLSAYGELIIEDSCKVGHRGIVRQVILFEKLLLFLKKKETKKYTYKGHILTSELHVDQKFCETNPTMFKVSSLLHRHQTFVVDVGMAKKQEEWLHKLHGIVRKVIDQAKKGRLIATMKQSPEHQVKRRRIVEEVDSAMVEPPAKQRSSSLSFVSRAKAGRILSSKAKRSSRGDVRDLFSVDENAKLMSYSVRSAPPTQDTTSPSVPMQTIPESSESHFPHTSTTPAGGHDAPPPPRDSRTAVQYQERLRAEADSGGGSPGEHRALKQSPARNMKSSTSMDSLLSLSDVDFGMEEQAKATEEPVMREKHKLTRRAAIKVKRSKTVHGLSSSGSYSSIIKARAREAREASKSPPPLGPGEEMEDQDMEPDPLLPLVSRKLRSAPVSLSEVSSYSSLDTPSSSQQESSAAGVSADAAAPSGRRVEADAGMEIEGEDQEIIMKKRLLDVDPSQSLAPMKRPRSQSHDKDALGSYRRSQSQDKDALRNSLGGSSSGEVNALEQSVEVEIILDEDDIELGESCGQARLRGRANMPTIDGGEGEGGVEEAGLGLDSREVLQQAEQSFSSDGVSAVSSGYSEEGAGPGDFMIVEDSSDSEEEESVEDLELTGSDLEARLLETADLGEIPGQRELVHSPTPVPASSSEDQVVPDSSAEEQLPSQSSWIPAEASQSDEKDLSQFFSSLTGSLSPKQSADISADSEPSPVRNPPTSLLFQFEGSANHDQHVAELYGTLPHKKKAKSTANTPQQRPQQTSKFNRSFGSNTDTSRASMRRAEGFSRLLEFTRQQQVEMESNNSSKEFDMTQSLPISTSSLLSSIRESEGDMVNGDEDSVSMDELSEEPSEDKQSRSEEELKSQSESEGDIRLAANVDVSVPAVLGDKATTSTEYGGRLGDNDVEESHEVTQHEVVLSEKAETVDSKDIAEQSDVATGISDEPKERAVTEDIEREVASVEELDEQVEDIVTKTTVDMDVKESPRNKAATVCNEASSTLAGYEVKGEVAPSIFRDEGMTPSLASDEVKGEDTPSLVSDEVKGQVAPLPASDEVKADLTPSLIRSDVTEQETQQPDTVEVNLIDTEPEKTQTVSFTTDQDKVETETTENHKSYQPPDNDTASHQTVRLSPPQEIERREEEGLLVGFVRQVRAWMPGRAGLVALGVAVAASLVMWYGVSGHYK